MFSRVKTGALGLASFLIFAIAAAADLGQGVEFVWLPSGQHYIGCDPIRDAECSEHEVSGSLRAIDGFYLSKYETTLGQYQKCVAEKKCSKLPTPDAGRSNPRLPVTMVSWDEATRFCQWLGGDLPTHDQWEAGARALDGRIYVWGDEKAKCGESNSLYPCNRNLSVGGSFTRDVSLAGIWDLIGNAEEWVKENAGDNKTDKQENKSAGKGVVEIQISTTKDRSYRGGSFRSDHWHSRITFVGRDSEKSRRPERGFRCVRLPVKK